MHKIEEAQNILKDFDLPYARIPALTLLALSGIKPEDEWKDASSKSMTLTKDIIEFTNTHYEAGYKPNTRESFRKAALKPFIDNNIVLLNPDNPSLKPSSSNTHYALSKIAIDVITKYGTDEWEEALTNFRRNQFPKNIASSILLRELTISNYKSILEDKIELGRFNVFIGVNGCGKSNILEAIATVGASVANELDFEGLYSRGVRMARPDLTISSFLSTTKKETIDINLKFESSQNGNTEEYKASLHPENANDFYTNWIDSNNIKINEKNIDDILDKILNDFESNVKQIGVIESIKEKILSQIYHMSDNSYHALLSDYAIFDLNTKSLRGVIPADSRKTPLGINGEGLDLLIANFNNYEKEYLKESQFLVDWLDSIYSDKDDNAKLKGLKLGRSSSTLYFKDKYMQKQNNTFSAENSNEGILHILFYISLFISSKTPNLLAIDNIETALNPRLCQKLVKMLVELSVNRGKQALITTHNPAVLDGLNLSDDEQRLFEVYRDSEGKTKTRRIKFKADLSDKKFKLSDMWLKGSLGAVPQNF